MIAMWSCDVIAREVRRGSFESESESDSDEEVKPGLRSAIVCQVSTSKFIFEFLPLHAFILPPSAWCLPRFQPPTANPEEADLLPAPQGTVAPSSDLCRHKFKFF